MITYIRGILEGMEEDKVIVDVGGVGYGIYMAGTAMGRLPALGKEVKIHTHLHVKEDLMQLYGFLTRDELRVFRLLIGVSGIGPKGGLGILSALGPDDLRFAVASNDVKAIQAAPGIGKKTAEKLILELKDKLKLEDALENAANAVQNTADTSAGMANDRRSGTGTGCTRVWQYRGIKSSQTGRDYGRNECGRCSPSVSEIYVVEGKADR